jgi:hypothetical protein
MRDALGNVQREYVYLGDIPVMAVRQGAASGGAEVVVDNGSAGFTVTGTWPASTSVSGYLGTNYQVHAAGTGASVFTWTLNVPSDGTGIPSISKTS